MKQGYIYKITSPSGKVYVGQTINLKQRLRSYKGNHTKSQSILTNSISKYGWDAHTFEIIEEVMTCENKILLNEREIYWIEQLGAFGPMGLNCTAGGDGQLSRVCSQETRDKISKAHKGNNHHLGHKNTEESKDLMSESAKKRGANRPKGFTVPEDVKEKIRQAKLGCTSPNKGKAMSEEQKEKLRQAHIGKPAHNKGKPMSEEQKEKIRQTKLKKNTQN